MTIRQILVDINAKLSGCTHKESVKRGVEDAIRYLQSLIKNDPVRASQLKRAKATGSLNAHILVYKLKSFLNS